MPDLTLDLRYLKYAVQVAEAGSFRRAAERLSVSQSTVSRRVQLFERQLGFSLFKRTRAGAGLTPEGERFLQQAVVGARYLRNAATEIRSARTPTHERTRSCRWRPGQHVVLRHNESRLSCGRKVRGRPMRPLLLR